MFSVVITTKDRLDYLERLLKSIADSSVIPKDVVIINDGGELIPKNILFNLNVNVVNNSISKGANFCRNLGVKNAKCEIVFLIDDDDAVSKTSFKKRLDIMLSDSCIGLCFTGIKVVSSKNLNEIIRSVLPRSSNDYERDLLIYGNIIGSTSRATINKSYFWKAGGFDENLACFQDFDLWLRMSQICKVEHDNESNLIYTIHETGNQISKNFLKYLNATNYLINKHKKFAVSRNSFSGLKASLFLRVAISALGSSVYISKRYSLLSFISKPSLKALAIILIPSGIIRKYYKFI
jgi:glycosyltransferase involved in cell wall biosynthesis